MTRVGALAWLLLVGAAASVSADVSVIPLPAFDTDPNSGETYGVLPVVLVRDADGKVLSIVAPSLTYNEIRGVTGTFRYFAYPTALERLDFVAGYSQRIEREIDLRYRNLGLMGGRFHGDVEVLYTSDASVRFFGLGPTSEAIDETNMTLIETGALTTVGVNITPTTRLSLGESLRWFDVKPGGVPGLPFTGTEFPDLPGVRGARIHAQRLAFVRDGRDSLTVPRHGMLVTAYAEASAELLGSDADYVKTGLEAVYLYTLDSDWATFVVHGLLEVLSGDPDTPFQVLPSLGGDSTLRGFSDNRFFGEARVLVNAEARLRVAKLHVFGVRAEFEVAPFVDAGRVFESIDEPPERLEVTPGIALRALAPPSVVGRVEIGVGREGAAIFVGLDYPF